MNLIYLVTHVAHQTYSRFRKDPVKATILSSHMIYYNPINVCSGSQWSFTAASDYHQTHVGTGTKETDVECVTHC